MDNRCPRKLNKFPDSWCMQAALRLKAIRNANRELTEEEERSLPGCNWAISCRVSNYCFFQYVDQILPERPLADVEIAGLLNISIEEVRKLEKSASNKLKQNSVLAELGEDIDG